MLKNMMETEGPQMTSQYGAYALRAGLVRLYARTHARTRNHAHTDQYVILIVFPQQQWFREGASMLRYSYIACLVFVACCVGSGLCDVPITRSEELTMRMCLIVCDL